MRARGEHRGGSRRARSARGLRSFLLAACVLAVFGLPIAGWPVPAGASPRLAFHDGYGLRVLAVSQVDPRLYAVVLRTSALPDPVSADVLLPPRYFADPHRSYPVLYLLDGTSGRASDWTVFGHAEQVIGDSPMITVMPDITLDGDGGGWCTNWPNGAERWETFHIDELIPWIDANLRTIPTRAERAIAGLSQGGFCSMSYAARHPDLFSVALSYSGAPDIYFDPDARVGAMLIINATEVGLDRVPPDTFFGDPVTDGINWAAHDPATLAENLRATRLYLYWGNGLPGPYDTASPPGGANLIEGAVWRDNNDFEARLESLHIPAFFDDYGPGTHSWPYWTRDLAWSLPKILSDFAHPRPDPSRFTYTSADQTYSVYGWQVTMHRAAREFSTLEDAGPGRFSLAGSGSASVRTPPRYVPGARYKIRLSGERVAPETEVVTAGGDGRLELWVPLGPPNPYQQDTLEAEVAGTAVYTTTVTVARLRS